MTFYIILKLLIGDWNWVWGLANGDWGSKKNFFIIFNDFIKISIFRFFLPFSVFWKWQKKYHEELKDKIIFLIRVWTRIKAAPHKEPIRIGTIRT